MRIFRRKHWNVKIWKMDVLARIKKPGCPVCTHYSEEVDREFFWFVNEQYYEPEVVDDLRRSNGFCPIHTRYLLKTGASSVNTTVFSYLTEYVIARFQEAQTFLGHATARQNPGDRCRQAAEIIRPQGDCRSCRGMQWWESHLITTLLQTLPDDDVQAAYQRSSGLCLPHFHNAGLVADWDSLAFLTADIRRRLTGIATLDDHTAGLFEQAAGLDRERSLRRRDQKHRASDLPVRTKEQGIITLSHEADVRAISWSPTFGQTLAALAEPRCPVCNARERGLQDYFHWLAREMQTVASPSVHWDLSWKVCPVHFWGLCAAGYEQAATLIARHTLQEWLWKLDDHLVPGLAQRPSDGLLDRLAAVPVAWGHQLNAADGRRWRGIHYLWRTAASELESPARRLDRLRAPQFREDSCQACWHVQETTRRTIDLILRVMEDPAGRQAYHQAWGLCLRHCIAAASIAENPDALSELLAAQITHLRLLEWELQESSRKLNWSVRYEPKGREESAWRRAAYQFCGV